MVVEEIHVEEDDYFTDSLTESHKEFYDDYFETLDYKYNINDCMLVRITNFFPFGGTIETPQNANATVLEYPQKFSDSINEIINGLNITKEEKERIKESLKVLISVPRNTIHFCINGLVGDHDYGVFQDRPFIILEPLKHHTDNITALRVEDTYYEGNMELSDEAVIIIRKDIYERIKDDPRYQNELSKYKIYVFDGLDAQLAVGIVLNKLGYDAYQVSSNGYINGIYKDKPAGVMYDFINTYAEVNNIDQTRHFDSERGIETKIKMNEELEDITKQIIYIMATSLNKSEQEINNLYEAIKISFRTDSSLITNLIKEYGLDKLVLLISKINQDKKENLNQEKNTNNINK